VQALGGLAAQEGGLVRCAGLGRHGSLGVVGAVESFDLDCGYIAISKA
jgi:hypothetical protein